MSNLLCKRQKSIIQPTFKPRQNPACGDIYLAIDPTANGSRALCTVRKDVCKGGEICQI